MSEATPATGAAAAAPGGVGRDARGGLRLFRVAGIQIRLDYSWLLIFFLIWWSLSAGYFPRAYPEASALATWGTGLAATLLFFLSVLAHELSHSLVAKRLGLDVPSITLFLFGGASEMAEEPGDPGTEFRIAIVGPFSSFVLAAGFAALAWALPGSVHPLVGAMVGYLAWINVALGVFNLLPGLPLDGGRVLRALVWWRTGSLERGSKVASDAGKGLAFGVMALGALQIFGGALLGGLWLILIGMFLRGLAGASYRQLELRQALEGVSVAEIMIHDVVTVPPGTSVRELVDDYILTLGFRGFPVVENGRVVGTISLEDVKEVKPTEREQVAVRERMVPLSDAVRVSADTSLQDALLRMARADLGRLLVLDQRDGLRGMITRTGLARFLDLRQALHREGS